MVIGRYAGGVILALSLSVAIAAEPPTTVVIGTPPQPAWQQLSAQQKLTLAPLAKDWDSMENLRKRKWLGIAERFPAMTAEQQQRMQQRMREWAALTPDQRSKVRDTYKDFAQLPPEQKRVIKEKWEAYSNLPADEKQRVRGNNKSATLLHPPPAPSAPQGESATTGETLPPAPDSQSKR